MPRWNKIYALAIIAMLYLAAYVSLHDTYNIIALYAVLPFAFALTFFQSGTINVNRCFTTLMILYLWVAFTTLFSTDVAVSVRQLKQIVGCIFVSYIVAVQARNEKTVPWLYVVYVIIYAVSVDYAVNNIMSDIEIGEERVDDDKLNANTLAYYTFYTTFIVFLFGEIIQRKWVSRIFRTLFFGVIPLSLWIAYITASRQVLIIQIPLIALLLIMRYWSFGGKLSKVFIVLLLVGLTPVLIEYITPIFNDSLLLERAEDIGDDSRLRLVGETLDVALSNPIVGVGPGCVRLYLSDGVFSHNTFLELFAGTGFIGMLIFIILLWRFFSDQIKRYAETHDRMYLYFLIFGIFFVVDQVFFVFYQSLYLISFLVLVASHSDTHYQNSRRLLNQV